MIVAAGLVASTLVTASPAQAEVTVQPALSHFHPLQPPPGPGPQSDPRSEAAELQQHATLASNDVQNLPPDQRPEVQLRLWQTMIQLVDLLRKAQSPSQPCFFPSCLPGL